MRKLWLLIGALAGLALALTACGSRATAVAVIATARPSPTPIPVTVKPGPLPLPTSEPATCTVAGRIPTPGPTEESLFPGVSQADWKLGPDGAKVVFIEYGDFQ